MAYFPFFMDLSQREGLIVGGGAVALRKAEKLLPYTPRLTVCAPEFCPQLAALPGLALLPRAFAPELLEGKGYVIAATDCRELNHRISALCQARNIPVNVVDDRDACTFLFPALVKRGDLSVGISTSGASPSAAIHWKREISALIPENFGEILTFLESMREPVKAALPHSEPARAKVFSQLFAACLDQGGPLDQAEAARLLDRAKEEWT